MQLHNLKRKNPNKTSIRVGRGGKRGKTSGRGHKGQNARAGTSKRPEMREIIKKLPKKRGYRFNSFQIRPEVVNLSILEKNFANNEEVSPKELIKKGIIKTKRKKIPQVKILGNGEITKKVQIVDCLYSQNVKDKVEKAGGKIKA